MKTSTLYLLFICAGLAISSCRCKDDDKPCTDPTNPKCENYDPCHNKKPTADFTLRQWDGWVIIPEDCDTILLHGILQGIRAQATAPTAGNYLWQIDDREFADRELRMNFSDYKKDSNNLNPDNKKYFKPIPITLTVRNAESQCVAAKDTVLSTTRNLVFVNGDYMPWYGKFKGISDFDGQERIVEIVQYFKDNDSIYGNERYGFINFPNLENLDTIPMRFFGGLKLRSFKQFIWDIGNNDYYHLPSEPEPHPIKGLNAGKIYYDIISDSKEILTFDYKYVTKDGQVKLYHFKGNKIE